MRMPVSWPQTIHPGEGARGHGWRPKGEGQAGSGDPGVRAPVQIWPGEGWADGQTRRGGARTASEWADGLAVPTWLRHTHLLHGRDRRVSGKCVHPRGPGPQGLGTMKSRDSGFTSHVSTS